jgi:hypothetical protein
MSTRRSHCDRIAAIGFVLGLVLPLFVLPTPITAQTPPAAQVVPQDAVICLQVSRPKAILDLLAGKEMTQAVTSSPFYQGLSSQPKFKEFLNGIKLLETSLETDWRTGLARLTGGGITIAVCPQDTVVAIIDAEDEGILQKLHEIILNITRSQAEKQGRPERVTSREYGGVTAWTFDGKEAHAIVGKRLLFASRAEGLKAILDLVRSVPVRASKETPHGVTTNGNLAASPTFRAARKAADPQAAATVFVDLKPLMGIPNIAKLFEQQRANPLAALVFAGVMESLRNSNWLSLGLNVEGKTLAVQVLTDGKIMGPANPAVFALPQKAGDGAWPNLSVPRRIAAFSLYRDLRGFYAAKDTLFPERSSGLIFFENMMGIFFTGRDLTSEVLAETEPEIRIVVAEQQYDPAAGTPQVKIPAFAAVLRLRHPEQFGKVVEEAWQKAVGLVNFTRGQKALPGLIIDRPVYKETKYTVAAFSPADANDQAKLDTRFNARPALAMPGKYLILSSTDGLACDLIDALSREAGQTVTPLAQTHSALEIDGRSVTSALRANRETIIQGDMIKKGKTHEESAAGIDMLITLVKFADQLKLSLGADGGLTQAKLTLRLNLP